VVILVAVEAVVTFPDYKRLITILRQIDPELVKALRKRYRQIGRPVVSGIKTSIPTNAPLSGMVTKVGRLSWSRTMNQNTAIKSVVIRDRKRAPRGKYPVVGLVQAVVRAAPVTLADMAGRSGAYINSRTVTREYDYTYHRGGVAVLGRRKHRINGQGRAMIAALGGKGSRYIYPGAEKALPQVKAEIQAAVNDAVKNVNQMLRSV
jgi:hypothetical protein